MVENTVDNVKKWWIFVGASLMIFLVNIDATIVNLALATIAKDLHSNLTQIQWVINSYLLTGMIFFIIGGKLSDIVGQKIIFLIGTLLFAGSSLIAALAPNFTVLIIGRLIQGIGFAFTLSLAILIISNAFPPRQRGFIVSIAITITGLGQAIGPTLGGAILDELSWHWIFAINVPLGVLSFIIISLFVKPQVLHKSHEKIDIFGAMLFGLFITALLLTFNALTHKHVDIGLFLFGLFVSLVLFILFYWKEIKTQFPLIDFRLFAERDYTLSIGIRFFYMYIFGNFLFLIPLFLQNSLNYSPLTAGLFMLIYSALFGICSPISGIWCDQVGYKKPIVFSAIVCLIAFILLLGVSLHMPIYLLMSGLVVFGVSAGIMIPSTVTSTLASLPESSKGEGMGMFFTIAFVGISLGVAISGALVHIVGMHSLMSLHSHTIESLSQTARGLLRRVADGTLPAVKLKAVLNPTHYQVLSLAAKQSFIKGLKTVIWVNVGLLLIVTVLSFVLKNEKVSHES